MKYFVLVMLLSASPVLADSEKPIVEPGWIILHGAADWESPYVPYVSDGWPTAKIG